MLPKDYKTGKLGVDFLPAEVGYLPEFFLKKAEAELNYTPSVRQRSLQELKEAMADDPILKKLRFNEDTLLLFLNSKKYDIGRTVLQIKKYVKFRKDAPYMFNDIKFENLLPFIKSKLLTPLPWRCQDGCALGFLRLGNWEAEKHPIVAFKQMFLTVLTQGLRDPMTQVNGYKVIVDFGTSPHILRICTPQNLYHLYCGTENVLPGRVKQYHLVNVGITGTAVWHIMKVFLTEKVKRRVKIHKSFDTLLDYFPKAILPVEYGGDLEDYDMTEWLRKVTTPEALAFLDVTSK